MEDSADEEYMVRKRKEEDEEDSGEVLLQEADEAVGGGVVRGDLRVVLQLRLDLLGQLLSQFNTKGEERREVIIKTKQ